MPDRPEEPDMREFQAIIDRLAAKTEPGWSKTAINNLKQACPKTIGKYGSTNTPEKMSAMLATLPATSPVLSFILDLNGRSHVLTVGKITLDWVEVFKLLAPARDERVRNVMAKNGLNEAEALTRSQTERLEMQ